ncbi:hypothetical protein HKX48_005423 [Thoreauomyces humboldtii]|nr:hypothetical protein HKX48_005423 [Thoreauomyces humboldtii]
MQQQQQQQNPLDLPAIPPISSSARHAGMAAQAADVDVTETGLVEIDTVANLAKRARDSGDLDDATLRVVKKRQVLAHPRFALKQQVEPQWATARFAQLDARLDNIAACLDHIAARLDNSAARLDALSGVQRNAPRRLVNAEQRALVPLYAETGPNAVSLPPNDLRVPTSMADFAASGITVNELNAVLAWYNLADGAPAALPARRTILRNFWLLG